jgi:hypothetical protein
LAAYSTLPQSLAARLYCDVCSLIVHMPQWDEHAIYLTETDDWVATAPTMRRALDYVCDLAGVSFHIEDCYGGRAMVFAERHLWTPPKTVSLRGRPLRLLGSHAQSNLYVDGFLQWRVATSSPGRELYDSCL